MQTEQVYTPSKRKKWIFIGVAALIVIIAAVNIAIYQSKKNANTNALKFAYAADKELSNTKLLAGQVVPGNIETLYPDATKGQIKDLYVKTGQKVTKGQKLFAYDGADLSNQLQQLQIDTQSANIQMNQSNKKIAALQKQIQAAQAANAGTTGTDPLNSQLQDLQFQQETTQLTIEKNKLQEEDLQNKIAALIVYSTISGIVQQANADAGQSTEQSASLPTPIVQIASNEPFVIQGTLTELQKVQVKPNQPIIVTANAVSGKTWTGKITDVSEYPAASDLTQSTASAGVQQSQNISYYNYKATLDTQEGLSPGYHVDVQVNLSTKKMLVVPNGSIIVNGNSSYVYVSKNNKLHKQTVSTGIGDGNSIEVLQGLKAGDKVVSNPSANVYDGMDVKAN